MDSRAARRSSFRIQVTYVRTRGRCSAREPTLTTWAVSRPRRRPPPPPTPRPPSRRRSRGRRPRRSPPPAPRPRRRAPLLVAGASARAGTENWHRELRAASRHTARRCALDAAIAASVPLLLARHRVGSRAAKRCLANTPAGSVATARNLGRLAGPRARRGRSAVACSTSHSAHEAAVRSAACAVSAAVASCGRAAVRLAPATVEHCHVSVVQLCSLPQTATAGTQNCNFFAHQVPFSVVDPRPRR